MTVGTPAGWLHRLPHRRLSFVLGARHINGGLHDVIGSCAGPGQRFQEVRDHLVGLRHRIVGTHQLTGRIQGDGSAVKTSVAPRAIAVCE